jgi:hypothetical protein
MNNKKSSNVSSLHNHISRRDFLKLSIVERRRILTRQAEAMLVHYQQDREWEEIQAGDLIEY